MKIDEISSNNNIMQTKTKPQNNKTAATLNNNDKNNKHDSVEISKTSYNMQSPIKAVSGKDTIDVTKSDSKFIIHFENSAILNRIIERGYLNIDGKQLTLSNEVKQKLSATNEKVEKANERAFMSAVMEHETAVAKQQSDALQNMSAKQNRIMQTASRIMQGKHVSQADEKELMMTNPELYAMAKSAALLKKQDKHSSEDEKISHRNEEIRTKENQLKNYETDLSNYQRFETQMIVTFEKSELQIQSITSSVI